MLKKEKTIDELYQEKIDKGEITFKRDAAEFAKRNLWRKTHNYCGLNPYFKEHDYTNTP